MHFTRNIRPASRLILAAVARGEDPFKTVPVDSEVKGSGAKGIGTSFRHAHRSFPFVVPSVCLLTEAELAKYYGSDANASTLQTAMFRY